MKLRSLSMLAIVTLICCGVIEAQVPRKLNYQGYLTTSTGAPLNTPQTLIVRIYDMPGNGTALFSETHTPVTVSNGIFNILLGSVDTNANPMNLSFSTQYYLGVTVGTDAEMAPRQPLAASPYSIRATSAEALATTAVVPGTQIAAASVTAAKLASNGCTAGQVLQYNGSAWVCTAMTNAVVEFASFFGMTAGPGNTGSNDYPATIASSAPGPSVAAGSALNFPRASAPTVGGIVINNPGLTQANNTEFILPSIGTYRVTWHVTVNEPAQWSLWINTAPTPGGFGLFTEVRVASGAPANVGQSVSSSQLVGDVVFRNTVANSAIQIRNYAAQSAVSVTPLPGGTQAQAVSLIIQRLQ